jgi:hypothetical protein
VFSRRVQKVTERFLRRVAREPDQVEM